MKIKDLADGVTYNFRIRAKTLTYGPEVGANITTGPGEGGVLNLSIVFTYKVPFFFFFFLRDLPFSVRTKEPQALLENPLFPGTALRSRFIGPAGIKAVHPSRDTSSRPDPLVSPTYEPSHNDRGFQYSSAATNDYLNHRSV